MMTTEEIRQFVEQQRRPWRRENLCRPDIFDIIDELLAMREAAEAWKAYQDDEHSTEYIACEILLGRGQGDK